MEKMNHNLNQLALSAEHLSRVMAVPGEGQELAVYLMIFRTFDKSPLRWPLQ